MTWKLLRGCEKIAARPGAGDFWPTWLRKTLRHIPDMTRVFRVQFAAKFAAPKRAHIFSQPLRVFLFGVTVILASGWGCTKPESAGKSFAKSEQSRMETEQSHQVWSKAYAQIHQSLDHADSMDAFDQAHTTCARIRTLIDRENPAGKNRLLADWNEQCQKGVRLRLAEWVILNVKESGHGRWCKIASERLQFLETTGRNDETTTDVAKRLHESCRNQHTLQQRDGDDDREDTAIRSQILRTGVSRNTE